MEGLFYLFALGVIFSGIMVISALNPVHSVLWLIFAFTNASALFILLEVEFIAFIFLIVYVGAIAILFIFVIMMLNLTDLGYNTNSDMSNYLPAGLVIGVVFLFEILIWHNHSEGYYLSSDRVPIYYNCVIPSPNIEVVGRVLYTDFYYFFLLASFILLVAMIGAIVLTHEINTEIRRQDIFIQTSRQLWGQGHRGTGEPSHPVPHRRCGTPRGLRGVLVPLSSMSEGPRGVELMLIVDGVDGRYPDRGFTLCL